MGDYIYDGLETCAVDGLCAMACPVSINTGELTKHLRTEQVKSEKVAGWIANNFALVEKSLGWGVRVGHFIQPRITQIDTKRKPFLASAAEVAEKLTGTTLPKWNNSVPFPTGKLPSLKERWAGDEGNATFICFPSCISRQLGTPPRAERSDEHSEERSRSTPSTTAILSPPLTSAGATGAGREESSLAETLIKVASRASVTLEIPHDVTGFCCGMPFSSKGYTAAYKATLHKTIVKFWEWSEGGKYPIIIDTTSCAHSLRTCADALSKDDLALYQQMTILDSLDFIHDTLLPRLDIHPVDEDVVLHPNCSARKLGLDEKMLSIAQQCARSAMVPLNLGCCAFAGDRGLLYPELTVSATEKESAEVLAGKYGGYYSSNITCEMGMSEGTGKDYVGIVYLVERATRL